MSVAGHRSSDGITLHSESLRVVVLPREGARIASIFHAQSQTEFLLQPPLPYRRPESLGLWDRYENSACAGMDECLPTVTVCGPEAPGGPVPDHGDFWRLDWAVTAAPTGDSVSLAAAGYSRPLFFEKSLRLHSSSLVIDYRIGNLHDAPLPFHYAAHPLFAIDRGDRIVLPPDLSTVRLEGSRHNRLGAPGSMIAWPLPHGAASPIDLSRAGAVSDATADMFYTGQLRSGWCGLYRAQSRQGIVVRFDPGKLPFLGLWLCYGGWPEDESLPRQHAVAFEPTVAPWATLSAAWDNRQAAVLAPRASFEFSIAIEHTGPAPITYDEFAARCSGNASL
ncbi:MAG: aldose epimerase [Acidobacteriota bacterium]|nr:aldose epimerase [Acidobacteriota bacterium]